MNKKSKPWSNWLGNQIADWFNTVDRIEGSNLAGRLENLWERNVFSLRNHDFFEPQQRRLVAKYSSQPVRAYTRPHARVCDWWNSLPEAEKTPQAFAALRDLCEKNMGRIFEELPWEWSGAVSKELVESAPQTEMLVAGNGPDVLLIYEEGVDQESHRLLKEARDIVAGMGRSVADSSDTRDLQLITQSTLVLRCEVERTSKVVSRNLKSIILVNAGYGFTEERWDRLPFAIRMVRKRLQMIGLGHVRLLSLLADRPNLPGCTLIGVGDLPKVLCR